MKFLILHSTVLKCKNNVQRSSILFNHFPISVPERQIVGPGVQNNSVLPAQTIDLLTLLTDQHYEANN